MIESIIENWGGYLFKFPELWHWNEGVYIYKQDTVISAIICHTKINEAFSEHLDLEMPQDSLRELYLLDNLFLTPVIIAAEYNDKMVVARVTSFLPDKERYFHEDKAYLPKEKFSLLKKRGK